MNFQQNSETYLEPDTRLPPGDGGLLAMFVGMFLAWLVFSATGGC